jgi:threonylcarbamoyladenosine tRNA methylthiotransferase MtaB
MGVDVVNFGCRLNIAEGEAIRAAAGPDDDLIVFNTCAVTAEAERQARQAIRRAARVNPGRRIVVTGCAAQIAPDQFAHMPEVAAVLGNLEKREPKALAGPSSVSSIFEVAPPLIPVTSGADHARAFVEVQNGCDHRCTFCIIPFGRGNSRSAPAGLVVDAVKRAVDKGQQEVILTGVDLTSYGADLPGAPSLGLLVERILAGVPDLPRLRLSSLDCIEIDDRLFDLVTGEARVMPYLHLSLQAGDDMILKRMKRRHSRAEAVALVQRIKAKRPDVAIGADIIAGFPTEDEAMFENSVALLNDCDIVYGHVFPFSPRNGTPAARMPQLAKEIIRKRAARLRTAADARKVTWLASLVGTRQQVLVELDGLGGHAENHAQVRLTEPRTPRAICQVQIIGHDGKQLIGAPQ